MKTRLQNYLLRYLFNVIVPEDIITQDKQKLLINGKEIDESTLLQLKAEVKALEGFRVWALMTGSVRHLAKDKIFNKSVDFNDTIAGKLMLYNLDVLESIVKVIKNK